MFYWRNFDQQNFQALEDATCGGHNTQKINKPF
jgi:hypothetical protein